MSFEYLRIEEVIDLQQMLIEKYGGLAGIRDLASLSSAIAIPAQSYGGEELHKTIYEKAAAYMYHITRGHPFFDGNKRIGVLAALLFLERNQLFIDFNEDELEVVAISVAAGELNKTELAIFFKKADKRTN